MNLVTFLKWALHQKWRVWTLEVILVTESASELNGRCCRIPTWPKSASTCQMRRNGSDFSSLVGAEEMAGGKNFSDWSDFDAQQLAGRSAGLNLLRIRHFLAEAIRNSTRVTATWWLQAKSN
jgi:hypothetical protein